MFYPFLEGDGQLYVNFSQPSFMNILVPVLQHFLDTLLSVDRYISRYLVCLMSDLVGLVCDDGDQTTEEVEHQDGGDRCLPGAQCPELSNIVSFNTTSPWPAAKWETSWFVLPPYSAPTRHQPRLRLARGKHFGLETWPAKLRVQCWPLCSLIMKGVAGGKGEKSLFRGPLIGPSPGLKCLLVTNALTLHLRHYTFKWAFASRVLGDCVIFANLLLQLYYVHSRYPGLLLCVAI